TQPPSASPGVGTEQHRTRSLFGSG
ncbi:hypothetical protein A2U01_0110332, partial [Trifolium medium]|nr:hypothetical protein [Trifolium medium]